MPPRTALSIIGVPRRPSRTPPASAAKAITLPLSGRSRVSDTSIEGYLAWINDGADPDTSAAEDAFSATLPIGITASAPGDHRVVVKRRNRYGLVSEPEVVRRFRVDAGGERLPNPPSAPRAIALVTKKGGTVRVTGEYRNVGDGDDRADTFNVYASVGADPDPSTDSPVATAAMRRPGRPYVDALGVTIGPYADGADVRVIVTAERTSDNVESSETGVTTIQAVDESPDPVTDPSLHYGGAATESV